MLGGLQDEGFTVNFSAEPGARLRCHACGTTSVASDFAVRSIRRLEGASDPDDMVAVAAAECPACSAAGTAVLAFGPMGSDTDADAMADLSVERSDDDA